jgi:hypothetical protein
MKYKIKGKIYGEKEGKKIVDEALAKGEKLEFEIQTDNYEDLELGGGLHNNEKVLFTISAKEWNKMSDEEKKKLYKLNLCT